MLDVLIESFVDPQYFQATAYKASGWQSLGFISGFKRVAQDFYQQHGRPKEHWVKELDPRAWRWLRAKQLPPPPWHGMKNQRLRLAG
jgi:hypothetical protein